MGFFGEVDNDLFKGTRNGKGAPPPDKVKPAPITEGVKGCSGCALRNEWTHIHTPRMGLKGNTDNPEILCMGEAPGEQEDLADDVFIGPTGKLLRDNLPGRDIDRIAFTNTVRCRPPRNRTPSPQESFACSLHLEQDIAAHPSIKYILGAGNVPLHRFVTEVSIMNIHGTRFPVEIGGRVLWYYPIFHPSFVVRKEHSAYESHALPIFQADIRRFFRDHERWPKPKIYDIKKSDVTVTHDEAEARALIGRMVAPLGVDIETSKLKPYLFDSKVLCAGISDGKTTVAFPIHHPEGPNDWGLDLLLEVMSQQEWIAHNGSFELVWFLWHAAGRKPAKFHDSMALLRLIHENHRLLELGLGTRIHLGINIKRLTNINAAHINEYSLADTLPYVGLDALGSALLFRKLYKAVKLDQYDEIIERVDSTTRMEFMGLPVSVDEAMKLKDEWNIRAETARREASKLYEVKEFVRNRSIEFNIGSPQHVGTALVEYGHVDLPKGDTAFTTSDEVLQERCPDHPLVKQVLAFREAQKLVSTYIDPFIDTPKTYVDGMAHPSYTVMHVSTYRSSSNEWNAQNVPKRKNREIRRAVKAPDGHIIAAADYGQMQVRDLAMASGDKKLIHDLMNGVDMHTRWLNNVLEIYPGYYAHLVRQTGETEDVKVRKYGRTIIKSDFVFNSFFGGGAQNITDRTGIPKPIVEELHKELWIEYPDVRKWQKERRHEYKNTGTVRGLTGIVLGRNLHTGNEAINFPVQNAEAEIVFRAQNELSQLSLEREDPYLHPRMNIHDDLTFILPDDDRLEEYIDTITPIMLKIRFDWQIVPLVVEWSVGYNWCDLEEIATFTGDYVR